MLSEAGQGDFGDCELTTCIALGLLFWKPWTPTGFSPHISCRLRSDERVGQEARRKQGYRWVLKYTEVEKFKDAFSTVAANWFSCTNAHESTPGDRRGEEEGSQRRRWLDLGVLSG